MNFKNTSVLDLAEIKKEKSGLLPLEVVHWKHRKSINCLFIMYTEQERICPVCDMDEIESEIHIMIFCPLYNDIRATLYESALLIDNDFNTYINMDKFLFLMDNEGIIRNSVKACHSILHRRRYLYIKN